MFDVSFSELMVIAIVALIVIGPEKLPKVARTLGAIAGRMQKYVAQVKDEVNREVRFEELQQLQQEIQSAASSAETQFQEKTEAFAQDLLNVDLKPGGETAIKNKSEASPTTNTKASSDRA